MTLAEVHVEGLRAVPSHLLGVVVGLRRYSRAAQRASEAALTNFSKALSREVSPQGIRVNTIVPGPVSTDLWTGLGGMADTIAAGRGIEPQKAVDQAINCRRSRESGPDTKDTSDCAGQVDAMSSKRRVIPRLFASLIMRRMARSGSRLVK
jgi:NAD(P)-dependent dehydrogenase (short-subunit alcohol dehydrogenase family)